MCSLALDQIILVGTSGQTGKAMAAFQEQLTAVVANRQFDEVAKLLDTVELEVRGSASRARRV